MTLSDKDGNYPEENSTWQFNLKFDINSDQYSQDSISLLANSGINFTNLFSMGIRFDLFGEHLITSGLLLNEDIIWISFHGVYDFAYLLKVATGLPLPDVEKGFFENLKFYFPNFYDIRFLVRYSDTFRGSLSKLGQELNINRIGIQHQAGSDSIVTHEIFFKLKQEYFSENLFHSDKNILFGMGHEETENDHNTSCSHNIMTGSINNVYPNYYHPNSTYQNYYMNDYYYIYTNEHLFNMVNKVNIPNYIPQVIKKNIPLNFYNNMSGGPTPNIYRAGFNIDPYKINK
jgi:CCR4-NOT transcription complex subunit 7/8